MAEGIDDIEKLKIKTLDDFSKKFGQKASHCVFAPGRVNIIGEHTDYNEGFVLPMALPLVTMIAASVSGSNMCNIVTMSSSVSKERVEFDISNRGELKPGEPTWANYIKGCIVNFPTSIPGFNAVIRSTIPVGAGLSSSAALEVATYTLLEALTGNDSSNPVDKALACQKAEHDFAGVPCGIMDQFISVMGEKGHALLLDCRDLSVKQMPLHDLKDYIFLITNSNAPHKLSSSAYCERRDMCYKAAKELGKKSLRDVALEDIEYLKAQGAPSVMLKRVRHVVSENLRTLEVVKALQIGDYEKVGELMNKSHDSLRNDYEVSSPELDTLVTAARSVQGVKGSRLTGAGFGGCTITLLKKECVDKAIDRMQESYSGNAKFYIAQPSTGARKLDTMVGKLLCD